MKLSLLIAGDLVPTHSNIDLFRNADLTALLGEELLSLWNSADFRIFNLEVPLTDTEEPIAKSGPNLIAPTNTVKGIKDLKPSLITLANNHILDQGIQGLKSTEDLLNRFDIQFIGIGDNLSKASKPYILEQEGVKIGIYACAEHEFTVATESTSGANPFDPLESLDHIQKLKEECDYVIVLYHGGKEHYRYPSPYLQKVCRKMSQKGADLVICQHSHCIGSYENYEGSTIIYGQGNFIFDRSNSEYWETSLLIKVNINDGLHIEYVPIIKYNNSIRLADEVQIKDIMDKFLDRSLEIIKDGFIEYKYFEFSQQMFLNYLSGLNGENIIFRIINKITHRKFLKLLYSKKSLRWVRNIIECEAHRELVLTYLSKI